jgi:uncharacterized protein YPO0396
MTRQHPVRILAAFVLVGAGAGALAGCGDDEPSTEEATADVCNARENVDATLATLGGLDPTDTSELSEVRQELADDIDELSSAGKQLNESQWDSVEEAWDNLRDTIENLDEDTTFSEAADQLASARAELNDAWDQFVADVEC